MRRPIDDAFAAGDAVAANAKQAKDEKERKRQVYDAQLKPLVRSCVDAVQKKAEEYNAHPRITKKAAIRREGTHISISRASTIGMKGRRVTVGLSPAPHPFVCWAYQASPHGVPAEYEPVDSGMYEFYVAGNDLRMFDLYAGKKELPPCPISPAQFAEQVLGKYVRDCARDEATEGTFNTTQDPSVQLGRK